MFKEIIKKSPNWIQNPIKSVYYMIPNEKKFGATFKNTYDFLQESQWWSKKQHEEYQMMQISKLLEHAYKNVPYYTNLFDERNITPKNIQDFDDLKKLPYLTKQIIQKNFDELTAQNYNKRELRYVTTGGTTGLPMGFYQHVKKSNSVEWAFIVSQWNRVGYNICKKNRSVILRGIIPKNGLYEYRGANLILSSFNLTQDNMRLYITLIENFNPDFIQAYPSSISILSEFILKNKIKIKTKKIKAILCGSENLFDFQRKEIKDAFNVRVYSWYGHSEQSSLAGECENNSSYHLFSEYGYTELVKENDECVLQENEVGEIVCTGFNNYVFPFIRYKTEDIAINTNEICNCGRNYKLIKGIEGRKQNYFIDKLGNNITYIFHDVPLWNIKEKINAYQYKQMEKGKIILSIDAKSKINKFELENIKEKFLNYYPTLSVEIELCKYIKRTKQGKFRYFIQEIDLEKIK